MSYCINPNCRNFNEPGNQSTCPDCGSESLVEGRYRVIQRLGKGGFGQTFEVEDVRREGTKKVLKILLTDYEKAICLFQREAEVLKKLNHQGIPKVEADGYFQLCHLNSEKPLHCLVMEKIEGINLKECLSSRNHQPISQKQAIAWLKQLAEILQQVHQSNYFHRDIKPSNIMLRPDNQLVLIDFGAVREATETYLHKLAGRDGTVIISHGYTPPEQADGRAVSKSDFYALGRTFIHLLTGIHPHDLPENPKTGQLNWRNSAPQVSPELATLINDLMAPFSGNRPNNAQEIVQRLEEIETQINSCRRTPPSDDTLTLPPGDNRSDEERTRILNSGNTKLVLILVMSAILLSGVVAVIYRFAILPPQKPQKLSTATACDSKLEDDLSCGEEVLIPGPEVSFKQQGVQKFARGKYAQAVNLLNKARDEQPSDPETLIYLNNARLGKQKAYIIAVVAPIDKSPDTAMEILRGVAQAQEEINQGKKINGVGLRVVIADDANNRNQARQIAEKLVLKEDLLAVVGHYASEVTLAAMPVYQKHGLVVISPGSTSEELSQWGTIPNHVFFRTVANTQVTAKFLTNYLIKEARQNTAAIFYAPQSSFSQSLRNQFLHSFTNSGKKVVMEFDLSNPLFNAAAAIAHAKKQGATAFAVFPDGGTTTYGVDKTLKLIKANQGRNWIGGGSTLYNPETLQLLGKDASNRFVVVVPWHQMDSPNQEFPQAARKLWKGDVSWRTATAYDGTLALIKALEKPTQSSPSRISVQQVLADTNFQAQGATGVISFQGGDRKEPISTLVKVVPPNCATDSYTFVPVDYPPDKVKNLGNCKPEK